MSISLGKIFVFRWWSLKCTLHFLCNFLLYKFFRKMFRPEKMCLYSASEVLNT